MALNGMTSKFSYAECVSAYDASSTQPAGFLTTVDLIKASNTVDMSGARSCLAVGAGSADSEIQFIKRMMPDLRTFIGVDPDTEYTGGLRDVIRQQLPNVEHVVCHHDKIENWSNNGQFGLDQPVDVVLLFEMLYHLSAVDRRKVFETLYSKDVLADGGYVVINNDVDLNGKSARALWEIYDDNSRDAVDGDQVRQDMIDAGFKVIVEYDKEYTQNLDGVETTAGEPFIELYRFYAPPTVTHEHIRQLMIQNKPLLYGRLRVSVFQRAPPTTDF